MSLPRQCHLQDSRGSLYSASESHSASRVEHQSGRVILSNRSVATVSGNMLPVDSYPQISASQPDGDFPMVACSQPTAPSILTECQQSSGSLFSIVSAPPVPASEHVVKEADTLNNILQQPNGIINQPIYNSIDVSSNNIGFHRPATLPLDTLYCPTPNSRTLHSSLLEHQISEIEEEDNENLLTVSSITAKPLIAKSREICSNRQQQAGNTAKRVKLQHKNATIINGKIRETSASSHSSLNNDPPDGGYGWFIVFGAFSVQFWVAGLVKSYGVLYVEIMETFPTSTATVASWIPAILSALCLALAPVSSALCQKFSCRSVVFVGGIFCALGLTLSYFATSLLHLLFTFGILTGIGGGLSTTPGIVIVSQYFDKHRALANGICVSGTAAGSFILPVLIKHCAENFGFHGTILILGGCMLHVCFSATLYKPLEDLNRNSDDEEEDSTEPLNGKIIQSNSAILTNSTYLETCDENLNPKFIEHLFMEQSLNRLNSLYSRKESQTNEKAQLSGQESDDEIKDMIGETTFIKPMKKVRSSGILHSVEDLSTDSTWMYRKHSGTDSNRGSRRRRNVFANDEIISKIQAHLEKPLSPPAVAIAPQGLSKSMEIPTNVDNFVETKHNGDIMDKKTLDSLIDTEEEDDDPRTCMEIVQTYLDLSLLKNPTFILMCLSVTLMSVGCPYMLYYLPAHAISIGYNKSEAGYLVAVSAVLDLFGRLGLGWLSDLQLFDRKKTYMICILGAGIAVLTIPFEQSLVFVGVSAAAYGLCLGSWYVLMPVLLADIFGTERIGSSYGLVRLFQSIGAISVPPLAGFLRDLSGNYQICFYCMGSCMILGCLPLIVSAILETREQKLLNDRVDSDEIASLA